MYRRAAEQTILTEFGLDLTAFPAEKHSVNWLRLSPRTAVSGGKRLPKQKSKGIGASRVGVVTLRRSRSALGAAFRSTARGKGHSVPVFALAHQLAVGVPDAALRAGLPGFRRAGLRDALPTATHRWSRRGHQLPRLQTRPARAGSSLTSDIAALPTDQAPRYR